MKRMYRYLKIAWITIAVIGFIWMMVSTAMMVVTQNIWWVMMTCGSLVAENWWMDIGFDDKYD